MSNELVIKAEVEGYIPSHCDTMTVGELKELLDGFDESSRIYLEFDNGYSYIGIRKDLFRDKPAFDRY